MPKLLVVTLLVGLLCAGVGCVVPPAPPIGEVSYTPAASVTVQAQATASPVPQATLFFRATNTCDLLTSRDLASFFSSAEVEGPTHQVGPVSQIIFSTQSISATQSACVYYVFHQPGSRDMVMLQVTYWVDVPAQVPGAAWAQIWTDASSGAAQTLSGIGDGAFYNDGRLTFKKDNLYLTVEVVGTALDTNTSVGQQQQLDMEKQVALDALSRLQ
jgi:hypothetical protein